MTYQERDNLLYEEYNENEYKPSGISGIRRFEGIGPFQLTDLIKGNCIRAEASKNNSPRVKEFLSFLYRHPLATVGGFTVLPHRPGYGQKSTRCVIDSIEIITDDIAVMADFANCFKYADEFKMVKKSASDLFHCYAWWD